MIQHDVGNKGINDTTPYTSIKRFKLLKLDVDEWHFFVYCWGQWNVARRSPLSMSIYIESCASGRLLVLYAQDAI